MGNLLKLKTAVAFLALYGAAAAFGQHTVATALDAMCGDAEAYDPTDNAAMRANADDFCAVLLSEPHKARRQLDKMIIANRQAGNTNRYYPDVKRGETSSCFDHGWRRTRANGKLFIGNLMRDQSSRSRTEPG